MKKIENKLFSFRNMWLIYVTSLMIQIAVHLATHNTIWIVPFFHSNIYIIKTLFFRCCFGDRSTIVFGVYLKTIKHKKWFYFYKKANFFLNIYREFRICKLKNRKIKGLPYTTIEIATNCQYRNSLRKYKRDYDFKNVSKFISLYGKYDIFSPLLRQPATKLHTHHLHFLSEYIHRATDSDSFFND